MINVTIIASESFGCRMHCTVVALQRCSTAPQLASSLNGVQDAKPLPAACGQGRPQLEILPDIFIEYLGVLQLGRGMKPAWRRYHG